MLIEFQFVFRHPYFYLSTARLNSNELTTTTATATTSCNSSGIQVPLTGKNSISNDTRTNCNNFCCYYTISYLLLLTAMPKVSKPPAFRRGETMQVPASSQPPRLVCGRNIYSLSAGKLIRFVRHFRVAASVSILTQDLGGGNHRNKKKKKST